MRRDGILVVARDRAIREAFRSSLESRGWPEVETCASTPEAVQRLRSGAFGVAVVHSEVEDMAGLGALPILAAVEPGVRILFATPATTKEMEARARESGVFYYYIYDAPDSDELAVAVRRAVGPPRTGAAGAATVLVVDDDADFVDVVVSVLGTNGFRTLRGSSIGEGLRLLRDERPGLVILDIMMESATDGILFSNEVRRDPDLRHTPILAVSSVGGSAVAGYSPAADHELLPVDGFMEKPIEPEALVRRIRALVREAT